MWWGVVLNCDCELQFAKVESRVEEIEQVKVGEEDQMSKKAVVYTLKRAIRFYSTLPSRGWRLAWRF